MYAYRPDIDGLRAAAVLAVVLFHFDDSWVPGGFVGVDMFFVISGYLITANIHRDWQQGQFSFARFYQRRIRRILPAMTAVVAASLIVGHAVLLPVDLMQLSWSAVASQLSVANIYFAYFLDTSYFAPGADHQPLLHLWSLGVEEQYYLLWPFLLILALSRLRIAVLLVTLVALAFGSFALGQILVLDEPMFAYYMLPTRAGELLVGGGAYFALARWRPDRKLRHLMAGAGTALVVWSLISLGESEAFPGWNAIPVAAGTAFLIVSGDAGAGTFLHRLLSFRAVVAVGLVSYSMYLWHWPLLAFPRYLAGTLDGTTKLALALALVLISWLSWAFIEQPFRKPRDGLVSAALRQAVIPGGIVVFAATFLLATGGLGGYQWGDYAERLTSVTSAEPAHADIHVCQQSKLSAADLNNPACVLNTADEPSILLWGDSNAAHYVRVVEPIAAAFGASFRNIAHAACPPLLSHPERFTSAKYRRRCEKSAALVHSVLSNYDGLVISASWDSYFESFPGFHQALSETLEMLSSRQGRVLLLGRIPRIDKLDASCSAKALKLPLVDCRGQSRGKLDSVLAVNRRLQALAENYPNVYYADLNEVLCRGSECSAYVGNINVYFDRGHLSRGGAVALGRYVIESDRLPPGFAEFFLNEGTRDGTAGSKIVQKTQPI